MSETKFEIRINVPMIKELVSDKIYRSDASAFREQYVNALSHGCVAYHEEYGYTDDVFVRVEFDYGLRKVTIIDNGMGMSKNIFSDNFMSFGFSTVGKETNNTRSGMFGLGAISFFRIASACIVESWDRKTQERFTFMTRNTDESEFVENRTLTECGTKTEIFLKENVNIRTLIEMVRKVASNYPVVTILEVINSESEQSISSYQNTDSDSYQTYPAIISFKDYVSKSTNNQFVEIINNDEMELYVSVQGRNSNFTHLCRIPIDIKYHTGFSTYLNIKKEKIPGYDSKGNVKLQEVPKPDRDEVNEIATEYFAKKIEKLCDEMIFDINIKSFEEYIVSDKRWILNGYSVDDRLNPQTHKFIQLMREPVRYRDNGGIQKKHESLLNLFSDNEYVFFHPSLHKGTYDAIVAWIDKKENTSVVFVDNTNGLPIQDAKQFKKDKNIRSVIKNSVGSGNGAAGIIVRDGSYQTTKIKSNLSEDNKLQWPGGIYYSDGFIDTHELSFLSYYSIVAGSTFDAINKSSTRHKTGFVMSKKGEKIFPNIRVLLDIILAESKKGNILLMDPLFEKEKKRTKELQNPLNNAKYTDIMDFLQVKTYGYILLPLGCKNIKPVLNINKAILFVPPKLLHSVKAIGRFQELHAVTFLNVLKYLPNWTKWDNKIFSDFLIQWPNIFRRYTQTGAMSAKEASCIAEMIEYIMSIKTHEIEIPLEDEYENYIEKIMESHDVGCHNFNYQFSTVFPSEHLKQKAVTLGYKESIEKQDEDGNDRTYVYSENDGSEFTPIEINNEYYSMCVGEDEGLLKDYTPMIYNGKAIIVVSKNNNYKDNIVKKDGKLYYLKEIDKYT